MVLKWQLGKQRREPQVKGLICGCGPVQRTTCLQFVSPGPLKLPAATNLELRSPDPTQLFLPHESDPLEPLRFSRNSIQTLRTKHDISATTSWSCSHSCQLLGNNPPKTNKTRIFIRSNSFRVFHHSSLMEPWSSANRCLGSADLAEQRVILGIGGLHNASTPFPNAL